MVDVLEQIQIMEELKPLLNSKSLDILLTKSAFLLEKIASTEYHLRDAQEDGLTGEMELLRNSKLISALIPTRSQYILTPKGRKVYDRIKDSGFYQSNAVE